ncbi:sugar phosphate isomerase/epimerase family protein [Candidatus Latescibacterota bacterium]
MNNIIGKSVLRRGFISTAGALVATSGLAVSNVSALSIFSRKVPLGLQLYSLREMSSTDFPGVIEAAARIGFDGVEFAGYHDLSAKVLRKMIDDAGLKCCGTHTDMDTLLGDNFQSTVDYNKEIGNKYLIVPWLPEEKLNTKKASLETAALFNELDEKAKEQKMRVGYHNHTFEFKKVDGVFLFDIFYGNTNEGVIMQLDTGHALHGGGDPAAIVRKYPGRAETVHIKEYSASDQNALIGEGDMDWEPLFEACETVGGTKWYILEQERYPVSPIESVEKCMANMRKMGK